MSADFHLFPYEELKVGLLIEEILHDYGVAVHHSVHWAFFDLFLEEFDRSVLIFEHSLDSAKEAYPTCFLVVIDVRFVSNDLKANIAIKLFF